MPFQVFFVLTAALVAVAMDLRVEKVYNWWILVLWLVGLVWQLMTKGLEGLPGFLCGSLLPILLLFPLYFFRMLGPGDMKLFSALGGVMGTGPIVICILESFLFGGILSLGSLLKYFIRDGKNILFSRLRYFTEYLQFTIQTGKIRPYYQVGDRPENIHFTIAILMGVLVYVGGVFY
jgi:prepilin peptidase CpaA